MIENYANISKLNNIIILSHLSRHLSIITIDVDFNEQISNNINETLYKILNKKYHFFKLEVLLSLSYLYSFYFLLVYIFLSHSASRERADWENYEPMGLQKDGEIFSMNDHWSVYYFY